MSQRSAAELDQLLDMALDHLQKGDGTSAERLLREALDQWPNSAEALALLGVVQQQLGHPDQARAALEQSLALDPNSSDAHYNLAEVLSKSEDKQASLSHLEACVAIDPDHPAAWRRIADQRAQLGDNAGALVAAKRAAELSPLDGAVQLSLGRLQMKLYLWPAALETLTRAAQLSPDHLTVFVMLYRTAVVLGERDEAIAASDRAIQIAPDNAKVLKDRIDMLSQFGRNVEASEEARNYVLRFRDDPEGHRRLATTFIAQREFGAAARAAAQVIELRPDEASSYALLAEILVTMGRSREALGYFERVLELSPDSTAARLNYSVALDGVMRRDEAVEQVRMVLDKYSDNVDVWGWFGQLLFRVGRFAEAAEKFDRVLSMSPNNPVALSGIAMLASAQARPRHAWALYERAIAALSDDAMIVSTALMAANAYPGLSNARIFELHKEWARRLHLKLPQKPFSDWPNDPDPNRRLRIGYVSADFRAHSVAYFLEGLLSAHDHSQVELFAFDNTPTPDNITRHLHSSFDNWSRIVGMGDARLAELIRERRIDILVDLAGHTSDTRLGVFALRPAPVQVSYLGYPNTTGLPEIDYRFTDAIADPPGEADALASEKLVRLRHGFLCFSPPQPHVEVSPLPAGEAGPITFAAFNAMRKITDEVIALWCRVLRALPGSRLLLKGNGLDDDETRKVLRASFSAEGMDEDRVCFLPRKKTYAEHLGKYGECDIALDTFPYNGTTTTCEALWMGVPVITLAGDRHAARVSLSILTHLGLPELSAETPLNFVRIAVALANDRPRLTALRSSLRDRMRASPLMNGKLQAAAIEDAYRTMWRTWCASRQNGAPSSSQTAKKKHTILVEGWRWIPHSYAVVNQWQCLELLRRTDVATYHRDLPLFNANWRTRRGVFTAEQESMLEQLGSLPPDVSPDIVYRIAYRIDITPRADTGQTIVFGTAECPGRPLQLVYKGKIVSRFDVSPEIVLVTPSQWSKEGLIRAGADPQRVRVIPHGVDVSTYHPLESEDRARSRESRRLTGFTFLHVGSMTINKGADRLLRAFAAVCRKYPDSILLFKGLDSIYSSRQLLRHLFSNMVPEEASLIRPQIRYLGRVLSMTEMARLYGAADAYVSPYLGEAFNLPVLEAAACGLPIICTGGGSTDEFTGPQFARYIQSQRVTVVRDGFEQEELDPDPEHLAELMKGMIQDTAFCSKAASAGPEFVRERFTWAAVVDQLLAVFAETAN